MPRARTLAPALAAVLGLAVLVPAAPSAAQYGQRGAMVMEDGEGNVEFATYDRPDVDRLLSPEFEARDVELARAILALSDPQVDALRRLVEAYQARLAAIEIDEDLMRRGPFGPPPREGEDGPGMDPREQIRSILEDAGIDPDRVNGGDLSLSVGVGISRSDDGEEPEMNVNVSLGPAEGVQITDQERARLEQVAQRIAAAVKETEMARMARRMAREAAGDGPPPGEGIAAARERSERLREMTRTLRRERARELTRLMGEARNLLGEGQAERFPEFERAHRRRHSLPRGRFSGEGLDLAEILASDRLGIPEDVRAEAAPALGAWGLVLHDLLQRRDEALEASQTEIDGALDAMDGRKAVALLDRAIRASEAVRDHTLRSAEVIAGTLGAHADPFLAEVRITAFPAIYSKTPAQRAFERVREIPELSADALAVLDDVEPILERELDDANRRITDLLRREEPDRARAELEGIVRLFDPELADRLVHESDDVADALERRLAIDQRHMRSVYAVIPESLREDLPAIPTMEQQGPIEAEIRTGGRQDD